MQRDRVMVTTIQVFRLLDLLKGLRLAIYERLRISKHPNCLIHLRLVELER